MSAPRLTRRDALLGAAALAGCAPRVAGSPVAAAPARPVPPPPPPSGVPMPTPLALAGAHTVAPLPFAAGSLKGLSERLITSHHDNNYAGAVRNLNRVEVELAGVNASTPPLVVAALRGKELAFRNSKSLHEAYFANLGGDGKRAGAIETALAAAYGGSARWEEHMRLTALGLGGGSGWAILAYELDTGALRTFSASSHGESLSASLPLLVLDMYEHSYQLDFGAGAQRYVDAFFANVRWDEVNRRLDRATKMSALLRA